MWPKWMARVVLFLFLVQMMLPIIGLLVFSADDGGRASVTGYAKLFADSGFQQALLRSLVISALTVLLCIVLVTPPVWYAYMYHPRLLRLLEGVSFISFVIPAVVLGLGYVQFFSDPPFALAGTPDLLPFAFSLLAMPFYIQAVLNRLRFYDARTYHDAAQSLGSGSVSAWWRIQLPLMKPGIVNGSVLVFSMAMGEFTITQLTTGGSYITLPIYLQVMFDNNPVLGAALAVIVFAIAAVGVFLVLGTIPRARRA
ncbi:MAG: ABC transporter permease subunit [Alicyclobacillus sp.]|nr:ABC transporter permease subunit [Alicyclobacillus sp.]